MAKIGYSKRAAFTPAFALIAEGWNELVQSGMSPEGGGSPPIGPDTQVFYAEEDDGEIVGVVCFNVYTETNSAWIHLGFVEETSRERGIYRQLWDAVVDHCRKAGLDKVGGTVHPDNKAMQAVMRKLDRPLVGLLYDMNLT